MPGFEVETDSKRAAQVDDRGNNEHLTFYINSFILLYMNKQKLVLAFIEFLESELMALKAAAQATYEAATHEENKPENEYDTRAIEASYLAGAQAKRAGEIDEVLTLFKTTNIREFAKTDPISATALIEIELNNKNSFVFLMPKGGGVSLKFEGQPIQVITPQSVLGGALIGLKAGDFADVEINNSVREYAVVSVQ